MKLGQGKMPKQGPIHWQSQIVLCNASFAVSLRMISWPICRIKRPNRTLTPVHQNGSGALLLSIPTEQLEHIITSRGS
jgi:hypothetical protein